MSEFEKAAKQLSPEQLQEAMRELLDSTDGAEPGTPRIATGYGRVKEKQ